jgi:hypothetical protein
MVGRSQELELVVKFLQENVTPDVEPITELKEWLED